MLNCGLIVIYTVLCIVIITLYYLGNTAAAELEVLQGTPEERWHYWGDAKDFLHNCTAHKAVQCQKIARIMTQCILLHTALQLLPKNATKNELNFWQRSSSLSFTQKSAKHAL